jgi:hypothetical protein
MRGGGIVTGGAPGLAFAAALLLLPAFAGCRTSPTGVHVHVSFTAPSIAQLEFAVLSGDRATTIVPFTARPKSAGGALPSPQDVVVYLPEVTQTVVCQARAIGMASTMGEQTAAIAPEHLIDVYIDLAGGGDGGVDRRADDDASDDSVDDDGADGLPGGLENGQPCADGRECASTYCADSVCCSSSCVGTCRACNIKGSLGACTAIPAGQAASGSECQATDPAMCGVNGKCDGNGGCQKHTIGTTCKPAACDTVGGSLISSSQCDGEGNCVAGQTISCDPFICDSSAKRCYTICMGNSQCMPGRACNAQSTCGKKPNGAACAGATECFTGSCVDGICCNIACAGSCVSCSQPGKEGLCSPLPAGVVDPRGICRDTGVATCGTNGLCNGLAGCQHYAAGLVCSPRRCGTQPGQEIAARTCDGNGTCGGGATSTCAANFACNPATGACYSVVCTNNAQCATGSCNIRNGRCR